MTVSSAVLPSVVRVTTLVRAGLALAVTPVWFGVAPFAREAAAQPVEVSMTPTPTPTPPPKVAPIPIYPETGAGAARGSAAEPGAVSGPSDAGATGASGGVRFDRAGMFGVGIAIGNTSTGGTAKLWISPELAVQFGAGSGPLGNNVRFQLDLLYYYFKWNEPTGLYSLPFYAGVGAQSGISFENPYPADRTDMGIRVPTGMSVVVPGNPVELYLEIAADVGSYDDDLDDPRVVFFLDGQVGARYYF